MATVSDAQYDCNRSRAPEPASGNYRTPLQRFKSLQRSQYSVYALYLQRFQARGYSFPVRSESQENQWEKFLRKCPLSENVLGKCPEISTDAICNNRAEHT